MVVEKDIYYMTLDSIRRVKPLLKSVLGVDFLENFLIFMLILVLSKPSLHNLEGVSVMKSGKTTFSDLFPGRLSGHEKTIHAKARQADATCKWGQAWTQRQC